MFCIEGEIVKITFSCIQICLYLSVDSSDDGSAQTHAWDKADVKVPLENEWLHTGTYKVQSSVEEALPWWGTGVVDEADQEPEKVRAMNVNIMDISKLSHNQVTNTLLFVYFLLQDMVVNR